MIAFKNIQVKAVENKKDQRLFIDLPYQLYRTEKNWVPPLRMAQQSILDDGHPFWRKNPHKLFIALKDGKCIGRIAAFVNLNYNRHCKTTDGFFGFFEAVEDVNVFNCLFDSTAGFLKQHGCNRLIGPFNPDLHNELGILIDGFESPPYIMLTHHYPYYNNMIQACGLQKLHDFYSYNFHPLSYKPGSKMEQIGRVLIDKYKITIRTPDMKNYNEELQQLHTIYNDAFEEHWGFVPIPVDEFFELGKDLKKVLDKRMVLIAEMNSEPIGFMLTLPNINEALINNRQGRLFNFTMIRLLLGMKKIKSARVITVAVKKKYQHLGIGALFYPEIMKRGIAYGYHEAELSWVSETNYVMNALAKKLNCTAYKTYRVYSKNI